MQILGYLYFAYPKLFLTFADCISRYMEINGINIEVEYKKIKNMHLAVYPPDGRVHISAPLDYSEDRIKMYILQKWIWISQKQEEIKSYDIQDEREYISGEAHYYKGQLFRLRVIYNNKCNHHIEIQGDYLMMYVREGTSKQHRREVLYNWYRIKLKEMVEPMIAKWIKILGIEVSSWDVILMKARWGSCFHSKKKLLFNTELIKKPINCIEYVVAHEATHIIERTHSSRFRRILDTYLPEWVEVKKQLNEFPV